MKRYTKEYKDFLNESTLETTWITPKDLVSYLDLDPKISNEQPLSQWLQNLYYYNLRIIINDIFPKPERVRICIRCIKEVGNLYHQLTYSTNSRIFLNAIRLCDAYSKGKIDEVKLEDALAVVNRTSFTGAVTAAYQLQQALIGNVAKAGYSEDFKPIFLDELYKFDWSKIEDQIRGYHIFGE